MLKVEKDTMIYMLCPELKKTGGTELAHQLVYELNKNNINAIMVYYGNIQNDNPINESYKQYVNDYIWVDDVKDLEANIIIVPEINYEYLYKYKKMQKCIWWMSVDNYVKNSCLLGGIKVRGFIKGIKGFLKGELPLFERRIDENVSHFYQSEYARQYLSSRRIDERYRLSDYINEMYLYSSPVKKRDNNVLYNPQKGAAFTSKLRKKAQHLKWIPIENMTNEQVRNLLCSSKVYVDFGNHPGKDRFPREAAISGCCVITGKNGSAAYHEDIPIPEEFKFDAIIYNLDEIINKIEHCLSNYWDEEKKFDEYKDMIRHEKNQFEDDVKKIFVEYGTIKNGK